MIYAADDDIITTSPSWPALLAEALSARATMIVGTANLFADGLSMAAGDFSTSRS
jgi:hypothetical protein